MQPEKTEARIVRIKRELQDIGPMRPGSLSKQYSVCGKAGCRCVDPDHPRKHGPYYQLSYVHRGKSTSQFIRPAFVAEVKTQLANYKRYRKLTDDWVGLALELAKWRLEEAKRRESN
jgi:hypothetical protein